MIVIKSLVGLNFKILSLDMVKTLLSWLEIFPGAWTYVFNPTHP
jgi:hypothetical protein